MMLSGALVCERKGQEVPIAPLASDENETEWRSGLVVASRHGYSWQPRDIHLACCRHTKFFVALNNRKLPRRLRKYAPIQLVAAEDSLERDKELFLQFDEFRNVGRAEGSLQRGFELRQPQQIAHQAVRAESIPPVAKRIRRMI